MFIRIPSSLEILKRIGAIGGKRGIRIYLVGGPVRDIILGKTSIDLDLVSETPAQQVASILADELKGKVTFFPEFLTARIEWEEGTIDVATARREYYPVPAALPEVIPATMREDLKRRDFTINAMALSLHPDNFGELFDPFGGYEDLKEGVIRFLHPKSFVDDPTRILRGLRFSARFGFRFEETTERHIKKDRDGLLLISGERRRKEVRLLLREGLPAIRLLEKYELLPLLGFSSLHCINPPEDAQKLFSLSDPWFFYFILLTWEKEISLLERLYCLRKEEREEIIKTRKIVELEDEKEIVLSMRGLSQAALATLYAKGVTLSLDFFKKIDTLKVETSGGEIVQKGFQGREIGRILEELFYLRFKGIVRTKEDEERWIERLKKG